MYLTDRLDEIVMYTGIGGGGFGGLPDLGLPDLGLPSRLGCGPSSRLGSGLGDFHLKPIPIPKIDIKLILSEPAVDYLNLLNPVSSRPKRNSLSITDFPASGFQLHIHDGEDGTAHLMTYERKKINISGYDAAMADLISLDLGFKKIKKFSWER